LSIDGPEYCRVRLKAGIMVSWLDSPQNWLLIKRGGRLYIEHRQGQPPILGYGEGRCRHALVAAPG
jgi:hypothetical protein